MLLLAWTTFAFAGVYPSSLLLPAIVCAALTIYYRPWDLSDSPSIQLDLLLVLTVILIALQLLPLPAWVVDRLSPADRPTWNKLSLTPAEGPLPLSIDLISTVWAGGVYLGAILLFAVSRTIFVNGGIRIVVRGISALGLVLAGLALAQDATGHGLMYWVWRPVEEGAPPFGPFVDRNHFATWVVLAVPLCLGYLAAHTAAHPMKPLLPRASWHRRVVQLVDGRAIWLVAAVAMMIVALLVSLSRSGLVGLAAALVIGAVLHNRHSHLSRSRRWTVAALGITLVLVAIRVDPTDLAARLESAPSAAAGRLTVWRSTVPVLKDFWLTGTGAGTFETAMLAYQKGPSTFRINAAHNHYLQIAAEGGLLLGVPASAALFAFASAALRKLREEHSGMYWLRAGAVSGLAGVAVQSVWETGLTTPANAMLAAIAAAIALHNPHQHGHHE